MQYDNDNELPRTRAEAEGKGLPFYCTSLPCRNGHRAKRRTRNGRCVECEKASDRRSYEKHREERIAKAATWKSNNVEKVRAYCLDRYHNNPKVRRQNKEWRERNPERVQASREKWLANNPEKRRESIRKYTASHPETVQSNVRKRRARLRNSGGSHTVDDIASILARQKFKCAECGCSIKKRSERQVDHIMPLILGGTNDPGNLQILCSTCNKKKGGKHPLDFAQERGRLV